jgi:hypothetical protein
MKPYLVLLRVEFTLLRTVASRPVRSYRTLSALPVLPKKSSAVFSLLHLSSACAAQALPGTLLVGARTFLPFTRIPMSKQEYNDKAAIVWSTRGALYIKHNYYATEKNLNS